MYEPLTDEQRKLVEESHDLIYGYAKLHNVSLEDYYGVLAMGLCDAAKRFDESKGSFSTFAYMRMRWMLGWHLQHEGRISKIPDNQVFSYNRPINSESKTFFFEMIGDNFSTDNSMIDDIALNGFVDTLSDKESEVIKLLLDGKSQVDIANMMGVKKQSIGYYVYRIRDKWKEYNED